MSKKRKSSFKSVVRNIILLNKPPAFFGKLLALALALCFSLLILMYVQGEFDRQYVERTIAELELIESELIGQVTPDDMLSLLSEGRYRRLDCKNYSQDDYIRCSTPSYLEYSSRGNLFDSVLMYLLSWQFRLIDFNFGNGVFDGMSHFPLYEINL